ncbi:MAG: hypothetical protein AAF206_23090 [Bacteroidota bacterium]
MRAGINLPSALEFFSMSSGFDLDGDRKADRLYRFSLQAQPDQLIECWLGADGKLLLADTLQCFYDACDEEGRPKVMLADVDGKRGLEIIREEMCDEECTHYSLWRMSTQKPQAEYLLHFVPVIRMLDVNNQAQVRILTLSAEYLFVKNEAGRLISIEDEQGMDLMPFTSLSNGKMIPDKLLLVQPYGTPIDLQDDTIKPLNLTTH